MILWMHLIACINYFAFCLFKTLQHLRCTWWGQRQGFWARDELDLRWIQPRASTGKFSTLSICLSHVLAIWISHMFKLLEILIECISVLFLRWFRLWIRPMCVCVCIVFFGYWFAVFGHQCRFQQTYWLKPRQLPRRHRKKTWMLTKRGFLGGFGESTFILFIQGWEIHLKILLDRW